MRMLLIAILAAVAINGRAATVFEWNTAFVAWPVHFAQMVEAQRGLDAEITDYGGKKLGVPAVDWPVHFAQMVEAQRGLDAGIAGYDGKKLGVPAVDWPVHFAQMVEAQRGLDAEGADFLEILQAY